MERLLRILIALLIASACTPANVSAHSISIVPAPVSSGSSVMAKVYFDQDFCESYRFDQSSLAVVGRMVSVTFGLGSSQCGDAPPGKGPFLLLLPELPSGDYQLDVTILGFSPPLDPVVFDFTLSAAPAPLPAADGWSLTILFLSMGFIAFHRLRGARSAFLRSGT